LNVDELSKEQILALFGAARADREDYWLMLLVAYLHGLRASEVIAIKKDDVKDGFLTVVREKGSETTVQRLLTSANPLKNERQALIDFALNSPFDRPLFDVTRQTVFNVMRRYGKEAGIPIQQCHPHNLKHTCGTHMYQECKDLAKVQKWLGHVSGGSTMRYLNTTQEKAATVAEIALCG
jgi:integrase